MKMTTNLIKTTLELLKPLVLMTFETTAHHNNNIILMHRLVLNDKFITKIEYYFSGWEAE